MLFSDSRQRAAKLARDMSDASDISAARQLFAIAIKTMEEQTVEQSMNTLYDYFCLAAGQRHVQMFHADERTKFAEDCASALNNYNRCVKRGKRLRSAIYDCERACTDARIPSSTVRWRL